MNRWYDCLANALNLPEAWIIPIVAGCFGFQRQGKWLPGRITLGRTDMDDSLFYNGVLFVRVMLPFFIGIGIRWSGHTDQRAFLQSYVGWKGNGQFSIVFRIQSDASAAAGYSGPNTGQAQGWEEGTK